MFGFLTPSRREAAGPLASVADADHFWRLLPRNDPLAAQKSISDALADLVLQKEFSRDQLRALLTLEQRARTLVDALLVNYSTRNAQAKPFERRYWRSALEFRHPSWFTEEVYDALRAHDVALVAAEEDDDATPLVATASWGYLRLRRTLYATDELATWAGRIREQPWDEAFVFLKHDEEGGTGPEAAVALAEMTRDGGPAGPD